ncbi:MAG: DUF2958 domain-containing protein [bacterium]
MKATDITPTELPPLGTYADAEAQDIPVPVKLFTPDAQWTWWLTEYDPETGVAFGFVEGFERELGYVDIAEIQGVRGAMGLPIERDIYWQTKTLREVMDNA